MGHSCLLFSKAGLWYIYAESVAIRCTPRRERWGERETKSKGVVCERSVRYSERKQRMNVISKRDSVRKVEGSSEGQGPMAKDTKGKLKERVTSLS